MMTDVTNVPREFLSFKSLNTAQQVQFSDFKDDYFVRYRGITYPLSTFSDTASSKMKFNPIWDKYLDVDKTTRIVLNLQGNGTVICGQIKTTRIRVDG